MEYLVKINNRYFTTVIAKSLDSALELVKNRDRTAPDSLADIVETIRVYELGESLEQTIIFADDVLKRKG